MWCRGIRGAITATENSEESILEATTELLQQMIKANDIEADQIASATFTTTVDLNAEYPAVAARRLGWVDTALSVRSRDERAEGSEEGDSGNGPDQHGEDGERHKARIYERCQKAQAGQCGARVHRGGGERVGSRVRGRRDD